MSESASRELDRRRARVLLVIAGCLLIAIAAVMAS
jgi:hypothetical protein